MYARLHKMKLIAQESDESARLRRVNAVAKGLSLHAKPIVEHSHAGGNYGYLLDLIDRFLDSKIDQQRFEDYTREMFGTAAYPLFTIDKLVHVLVRQIHAVVTEEASEQLVGLYYQHAATVPAAAAAPDTGVHGWGGAARARHGLGLGLTRAALCPCIGGRGQARRRCRPTARRRRPRRRSWARRCTPTAKR